jgi:hypothetical protein
MGGDAVGGLAYEFLPELVPAAVFFRPSPGSLFEASGVVNYVVGLLEGRVEYLEWTCRSALSVSGFFFMATSLDGQVCLDFVCLQFFW